MLTILDARAKTCQNHHFLPFLQLCAGTACKQPGIPLSRQFVTLREAGITRNPPFRGCRPGPDYQLSAIEDDPERQRVRIMALCHFLLTFAHFCHFSQLSSLY